jgi:ketosteroid isomerase-like protein
VNEQENVHLVRQQFAAFGKGDLSAVPEPIAEDADWQLPVTRSMQEKIPRVKPCHSREEVALWFRELLDTAGQKNSTDSMLLLRMTGWSQKE